MANIDRLKSVIVDEVTLGARLDNHPGGDRYQIVKISDIKLGFEYVDLDKGLLQGSRDEIIEAAKAYIKYHSEPSKFKGSNIE